MDEKLKSVLQRVKQLSEQNEEFANELRKLFVTTTPAQVICRDDERVSNIEKYLSLDYSIDKNDPNIDYSFISDKTIRERLEIDNREMMRCRYGTRFHRVDFKEFCRYALLQAEMLLNYYYTKRYKDIENIKTQIERFNESDNLSKAQSVSAISFNDKLWAFKKENNYTEFTWNNVRTVRNSISHRTPNMSSPIDMEEYYRYLKSEGIPLYNDGSVNHKKLKENEKLKAKFDEEIKKNEKFKEYDLSIWLHNENFEKICTELSKLANLIKMRIT